MKIQKLILLFGLVAGCYIAHGSTGKFIEDDFSMDTLTLPHVLKSAKWLDEKVILPLKPTLSVKDETVGYCGDVLPTSLYKKDKHYFLPTAPYVHTYNPTFDYNYVIGAYSLTPNVVIKKFFGDRAIQKCFLVFQRVVEDGTPQLLRLHGLVHGTGGGSVNLSVNVKAEIIPFDKDAPISFVDGTFIKEDSVYCHDGVASPSNFDLKGWKKDIYTYEPCWNSFGVYLPASQTASLIIVGQTFFDDGLSEFVKEGPALSFDFKEYLQKLIP